MVPLGVSTLGTVWRETMRSLELYTVKASMTKAMWLWFTRRGIMGKRHTAAPLVK